ncbi:MAG: HD domain-containing protein [Candidatus Desulforudis sp.]|nr:HD domain-containing protein [Desulforudis sp.]
MQPLLITARAAELLSGSSQNLLVHSRRVACLVAHVLENAPNLASGYSQDEIILAALLHDLGKLQWPEGFFSKPRYLLNNTDFFLMESHPFSSANLARQLGAPESVAHLIEQHHEKKGGEGYPQKLTNPDPTALLIGTCNAYAACLESRPYRPETLTHAQALKEAGKVGCLTSASILERLEGLPDKILTDTFKLGRP